MRPFCRGYSLEKADRRSTLLLRWATSTTCAHDELRAAVIIAGKRIKLQFRRRNDDTVLVHLRPEEFNRPWLLFCRSC